jgi:hypothetical protein
MDPDDLGGDGFDAALDALLERVRSYLKSVASDRAARHELSAVLAGWPRNRRSASGTPSTMPACDHLATALRLSQGKPTAALCDALLPVLHLLGWSYGYAPDPRWPSLSASIAFAQIVGPRGLRDDASVHLGLTLIAPHTHYPLHSHPAIELYLVLSGTASWRISGQTFAPRPPGSLILHESGIGHAMETSGDPLLALYTWRGDLTTAPVYVEE